MKLKRNIFFLVLSALHLFFFFKAINIGHVYTNDSFEYLEQAKNIRDHQSWYCGNFNLPVQWALFSQRPPGYGFFIAVAKQINNNVWFLLFLQNLLSIFNFYLLYRLLQLLNIKINPLLLLTPLLFFPSQFIFANLIMSEMALQTMVMLSFYFLVRLILFKETKTVWLYQLFITCALLLKPIWYLFPVVSILFFIYLIKNKNIKALIITTHLIPLVFIAGVYIYNHQKTNYWEYSSVQRKLMINYNVKCVLEDVYGKDSALLKVNRMQVAAAMKNNYSEQAAFLQSEINTVLKEHPFVFAKVEMKGVTRFFADHCRYDMEYFFSQIPLQTTSWYEDYCLHGWRGIMNRFKDYNIWYFIYLIASIVVNVFLLLCLFVFIRQKKIDLGVRIILFMMIAYTAMLTGTSGTTRFRLPVYLLMLISFAVALPTIRTWIKKVTVK